MLSCWWESLTTMAFLGDKQEPMRQQRLCFRTIGTVFSRPKCATRPLGEVNAPRRVMNRIARGGGQRADQQRWCSHSWPTIHSGVASILGRAGFSRIGPVKSRHP